MTLPPMATTNGPRKWSCDGCGEWSFWTEEHMIYGSLKDEDEGRWDRLIVTCSEACRAKTEEAGRAVAQVEPVAAV